MYQKFFENDIITNRKGEQFKILKIISDGKHTRYIVEGVTTGFIANISRSAAYVGKFDDKLISHNKLGTIIGYANTSKHKRENRLWCAMCERCLNPENENYKFYGAKGITICERWKRFDFFLEDLPKIKGYDEDKFFKGELQLDKDKSNKKVYSLETCEFISGKENRQLALETRQKPFIIYDKKGLEKQYTCIKECAKDFNLDDSCVAKCLKGKRTQTKGYYFKYIL